MDECVANLDSLLVTLKLHILLATNQKLVVGVDLSFDFSGRNQLGQLKFNLVERYPEC